MEPRIRRENKRTSPQEVKERAEAKLLEPRSPEVLRSFEASKPPSAWIGEHLAETRAA